MNYEAYVSTDKEGNLYITNKGYFYQHFKENPNSRFVLTVNKISDKKSDRISAYFYAEVLPKIIEGNKRLGNNLNKESALEELKTIIPVMCKSVIVGGIVNHDYRLFDELDYFEKCRAIDECIIHAAQDLDTVIEEPR